MSRTTYVQMRCNGILSDSLSFFGHCMADSNQSAVTPAPHQDRKLRVPFQRPSPSTSVRDSHIVLAEAVDARMLMFMRIVLAFSAFVIVCIDASEPMRWVKLITISLGLYCVYSTILAVGAAKADWPQPSRTQHWVDVFFYVYLVALTDSTNSIFFSFFLFSILVASFSWGFKEGLLVSLVSLASFFAVGLAMAPENVDFELNRALIRTVYLFVFGYMISYWGGYERLLKRRLSLLNEINNGWSPRFGVDHVIGVNLDRLLDFYKADSCILVLKRAAAPCCVMYRSSRGKPAVAVMPVTVTEKASAPLLCLPDTLGAFYRAPHRAWHRWWQSYAAYDVVSKTHSKECLHDCSALSNLLDAATFITLPYAQRDGAIGRLYLIGSRRGFDQSDIDFLTQVTAAVATVVENIALMEELISRASEQERQKISLDLHDTTIQPYIGLKLALDAALREAGQNNPISARLEELADMAGMTIRDLRDYAATFKEKSSMPGEFLLAAMHKKADRMRRFYGIDVRLDVTASDQLNGRLATEAFHIVSEGMSNILRHTLAKAAFIRMLCEGSRLAIDIGNQSQPGTPAFLPHSIRDRAQTLGGTTSVELDADGYTVVRISIPL
jgi:signal transduction histidine kinase